MNRIIVWISVTVLLVCSPLSAQNLTLHRLNDDLNQPVFATFAPNASNRLYVAEKRGAIRIVVRSTGNVLTNDFMTVPATRPTGTI